MCSRRTGPSRRRSRTRQTLGVVRRPDTGVPDHTLRRQRHPDSLEARKRVDVDVSRNVDVSSNARLDPRVDRMGADQDVWHSRLLEHSRDVEQRAGHQAGRYRPSARARSWNRVGSSSRGCMRLPRCAQKRAQLRCSLSSSDSVRWRPCASACDAALACPRRSKYSRSPRDTGIQECYHS